MRGEPRIQDFLHFLVTRQSFCHRARIGAVPLHTARKRAQAAQNEPRIEGRAHRTEDRASVKELVVKWLALFQDEASSLHIAVTAAVFRRGVQHDVSPKPEW